MEDRTNETMATGSEKTLPQSGERRFTQAELEKLIGERLKRERVRHASLVRVKELLDALKRKGVLHADSCAGAAEELCERLASPNAENARKSDEDGREEEISTFPSANGAEAADETAPGTAVFADTPEARYEENARETIGGEIGAANTDGAEDAREKARIRELRALEARHPEADAAALLSDPDFISYAAQQDGTLTELFEAYSDRIARLRVFEKERAAARALAATGFSAHGAGGGDYGEALSSSQREIARRAGMSYREYAELLSQIPRSTRKRGAD